MLSLGVVVAVDEGKDLSPGVVFVDEAATLEHFSFECADERFSPSVVIGIGSSRHALSDYSLREKPSKYGASVLAATITMVYQAL